MKAKLIFFDIDQTLHRKQTGYMPESAKIAIKRLREKKILTAIASGRSPAMYPSYLISMIRDGDFSATAAINGQYNCEFERNSVKEISAYSIPQSLIGKITQYFQAREIPIAQVSNEKILSFEPAHSRIIEAMQGIGLPKLLAEKTEIPFYQLLIYAEEAEIKQAEMDLLFPDDYETMRWHKYCVDFLHRNGAKSRGVLDICNYYGIAPDETMAFGDGHNDLEMIKTAGIGVAMKDGKEEILAAADYITGTVEEDGIYNTLKYFGLL